ncbi:hypothetical protein FRB94_000356 [Tulasnella sp. JGI-2019a]|nr:hypothetical protein FRB93_008315 [Tulasnella sp. JGI-2019a]KAG9006851.1 hypothetical protein FRB94_000356 [Tulasnella sp. JGI-2019a]
MPRVCKSSTLRSTNSPHTFPTFVSQHDKDTNPLFRGYVNSLLDAFLIIEGCRHGLIGRFVERPPEVEKDALVQSGNVVVWEEEEIGMQRWTDHIQWSETRSSGAFLIYREADEEDPLLKYGSNRVIPIPREARPYAGQLEERRKCRYHDRWVTENGLIKKVNRKGLHCSSLSLTDHRCLSRRSRYLTERQRNGISSVTVSSTSTLFFPYFELTLLFLDYVEDILSGRLIRPAQDPMLRKLIPTISQCLLVPQLYKKMVLNVAVSPAGRLIYESEWVAGQEPELTVPETDDQAPEVVSVVGAEGPVASEVGPNSTLPTLSALEESMSATTVAEIIAPSYSPPSCDGPHQSHQQRPQNLPLQSAAQPSYPSYEPYSAHVDNQGNFVLEPMMVDSISCSQVPWSTPQPLWNQTREQAPPSAKPSPQAQNILAPIPTSLSTSRNILALFDTIISSRATSSTPTDNPTIPLYPNSTSSSPWYQHGPLPHQTFHENPKAIANPHSSHSCRNLYPPPNDTEYHLYDDGAPSPSSTSCHNRPFLQTAWPSSSASSFETSPASSATSFDDHYGLNGIFGQIQQFPSPQSALASLDAWGQYVRQQGKRLESGMMLFVPATNPPVFRV